MYLKNDCFVDQTQNAGPLMTISNWYLIFSNLGQSHMRNYGGTVCFSCRQFFRRTHQVFICIVDSTKKIALFNLRRWLFVLLKRSSFWVTDKEMACVTDHRATDNRTSCARRTRTARSRWRPGGSVRSVAWRDAWWPTCVRWPSSMAIRRRFDSNGWSGVNFINILWAAFVHVNPKSAKRQ